MKKIIFCILTTVILSGCLSAKYKDISQDPQYSHFIGQKYQSINPLLIYGVTRDLKPPKQVQWFNITGPPGIGGPEIVTRGQLEPGSVFQIKKVLDCINCLVSSSVEFRVDLLSTNDYSKQEIKIDDTFEGGLFTTIDNKIQINPNLFKKID